MGCFVPTGPAATCLHLLKCCLCSHRLSKLSLENDCLEELQQKSSTAGSQEEEGLGQSKMPKVDPLSAAPANSRGSGSRGQQI